MRLTVQAPFHLEATVRLLQRLPTNRIDLWHQGAYVRVLEAGDRLVTCTLRNLGTVDAPRLELTLQPAPRPKDREALVQTLRRCLGLDRDPSFGVPGIRDPRLRRIARQLRGARPPRFPTLFESFGRIIPYQQLSLESGGAITGRFVERFGQRVQTPAGTAWAFPRAQSVARARTQDFAGIGLNRAKVACLRNLARQLSSGALDEQTLAGLPTDAALARLEELPGIGPWTAALVLLRGLGRMEVFPAGDAGVVRGLRGLLGAKASLRPIVADAGERRGYLYFHTLGARLLAAGLIHPAPG